MKIIVVSRGDVQRCHTLKLLSEWGIQAIVVVHEKKTARRVRRHFPFHRIVVSGTKELVEKRNWILNNLVEENEWFIGMDDNIQYFTMVRKNWRGRESNVVTGPPPKGHRNWRSVYNTYVIPERWLEELRKDIQMADALNIPLVGVSNTENPYFRSRRYSNYKLVITKVFAMKNVNRLSFENKYSHDSWLSALCVANYGKVLVDSFLHHKTKMNEEGGLGSREHRIKNGLMGYMKHTMSSFPGLMRLGRGKLKALSFKFHSEAAIERWRKENGYV
jgi:hypothetical protein